MSRVRRRREVVGITALLLTCAMLTPTLAHADTPSPSPTTDTVTLTTDPGSTSPAGTGNASSGATTETGTSTTSPVTPTKATTIIEYPVKLVATGEQGQAGTSIVIPEGMIPVYVKGTVISRAESDGTVIVSAGLNGDGDVRLDARTGGPFSIPLNPDMVEDQRIAFTITNRLEPNLIDCVVDTVTTETINGLTIGLTGKEALPTTVAQFFSPAVTSVTIIAPDASSMAMNAATLAAVAGVSRLYDRPVPVTVITADEITGNMQGKLGARILRLQATGSGIVHADVTNPGTPTLTLSGPVDKLAAAAEALGNPAIDLASMPSVTELEQTGNTLSAYTLTFADLGAAKPKLQGVGRIEYVIGVSQSRYPGPVSGFQIHIQGAYTPVPKTGQVTMSVLWNDQIIDSQLLNEQDIYLVDVKVDQTQVQRDNAITLRMDATPAGGACSRKGQPYQLDINGKASTLAANPGQGLAPGFARFPQTLGGYLPVAFGSGQTAATLLKDAAEIVSSLQRVSASSLHVETVSFEEFAKASYPGLVVGATPADADALKAPLRFYPWRAVDANGTRFTVTVDGPFAAFEAYNLDGRDLLMLGATGPTDKSQELMAKLAKAGNTDPDGWFSLNADLLVAVPGEKPFMIDSGTIPPQAKAVDEFRMLPWWLWALVAVLLIGLIIRLYTLRRRRQRIKREINEARLAAERSFGAAWQGPPQGSS